jgi:CubicO group peptidase (beta-lactamase class C family)
MSGSFESTLTLGATIDNPLTTDEWIARVATLPLIDQPGAGFHYSSSTGLLGFLIARLEPNRWATCSRDGSSRRSACATPASSCRASEIAAMMCGW